MCVRMRVEMCFAEKFTGFGNYPRPAVSHADRHTLVSGCRAKRAQRTRIRAHVCTF